MTSEKPNILEVIEEKLRDFGLSNTYAYTNYITINVSQRQANIHVVLDGAGEPTTTVYMEYPENYNQREEIELSNPSGFDRLMLVIAAWLAEVKATSLSEIEAAQMQHTLASVSFDLIALSALKEKVSELD